MFARIQGINHNNDVLRIVGVCVAGVLIGHALLSFSALAILGGLGAITIMLVVIRRPEIGLLSILVLTSSIVFEKELPLIPIGMGSLHLSDVPLLLLLGIIALRVMLGREKKFIHTPLDLPLLLFYGVALLSTVLGILGSTVEITPAIRMIRFVTYYLIFVIVTNLLVERRQLVFMLRGFFVLSSVVAAIMIAQMLVGDSIRILPGRVHMLQTDGIMFGGITRVLPPGQSLILVSFITLTTITVLEKVRSISMVRLLQLVLLGVALVSTFNRSFWVASILALSVLGYVAWKQDRQKVVHLSFVFLVLAAIVVVSSLYRPDSYPAMMMNATLSRMSTIWRSKATGPVKTTLEWRAYENEYVLRQIASHPLTGLGFGAKYRPYDPRLDSKGYDGRTYIHNGHLWVLMKSGLVGYLCLVWLSVAFLRRGFKYWRIIPDSQMRGIVLGFTLAYLGILFANFVNPIFMQPFWTPVLGLMMGTSEAILREIGPQQVGRERWGN